MGIKPKKAKKYGKKKFGVRSRIEYLEEQVFELSEAVRNLSARQSPTPTEDRHCGEGPLSEAEMAAVIRILLLQQHGTRRGW